MHLTVFFLCVLPFWLAPCGLVAQKQTSGTPSIREYEILDSLSVKSIERGDFAGLLVHGRTGLEKARAERDEQDSLVAKFSYFMGYAYLKMALYSEAEPLLKQAAELDKEIFGADTEEYSTDLSALGLLYLEMGNFAKAEALLLEALNIRSRISTTNVSYLNALQNLGGLYSVTGRYGKSIHLYQQSLDALKNTVGEEHESYVILLGNLASVYRKTGRLGEAEALSLRQLYLRKKTHGETHMEYARTLNALAVQYHETGDYSQAESMYRQVLSILEAKTGKEHPHYASLLNNLGMICGSLRQTEKAEMLLLESAEIRKKINGMLHPNYANSLQSLGNFYQKQKQYEKAEAFFLQTLDIYKKIWGDTHPDYLRALNNLGVFYQAVGRTEKAEALHLQVASVAERTQGKQNLTYLTAIDQLAIINFALGRTDTAFRYCREALMLNAREDMPEGFSDWARLDEFSYTSFSIFNNSIVSLLTILQKRGPENAEQRYAAALAAARYNTRLRDAAANEDDKLRAMQTVHRFVSEALAEGFRLKKDAAELFVVAQMDKASLLLQSVRSDDAYRFGELPDSLAETEKFLFKRQSELQAKLFEKRPQAQKDSLRTLLNNVTLELDRLTETLKRDYPRYADLKYGASKADPAAIRSTLGENALLLEYAIGNSEVYVFVLDKGAMTAERLAPTPKDLEERVGKLHEALSGYEALAKDPEEAYRAYVESAAQLYELLLAPVLHGRTGIDRLVIVPDGVLAHLPFEALLTATPPQNMPYKELPYLIRDYAVSYHYSSVLRLEMAGTNPEKRPNNNGRMLAMAATYTGTADTAYTALRTPGHNRLRRQLDELPAAKKEVEELSRRFSGSFALDDRANETAFKNQAPEYAVLHIAAHGILDEQNPMLSALVFTENGDSVQDNFLQAHEISKMNLNADLVVLSACETGFGRFEQGNGTASLARAFLYAGAPALVVSLWEVNDVSTSALMTLFYDRLFSGEDKAQALRHAKLDYLSQAKGTAGHPAFWSAFTLVGDENPVRLKGKNQWWWWLLAAASAGAVVLVLMKRRKKGRG